MRWVLEVCLAIIIVLAFIPVFVALEADYEISQTLIELFIRIFR